MRQPHLAILIALAGTWSPATAATQEWQMVQDYITLVDADPSTCERLRMPHGQRINPFLSYTALGSDFGFLGPGEEAIVWEPGHLCVRLDEASWGGVWHSLVGSSVEQNRTLDFTRAFPDFITKPFQPKIVGLRLRGRGNGTVKIEIKDPSQTLLWQTAWHLNQEQDTNFTASLPPLTQAKFLNWISLEGCHMCLDHIALNVQMPDIPTDLRVFLKSYAKMAHCYSPETGLVKDRAHAERGAFDSIPASGMFCLATAVAAEHGIVTHAFAHTLLARTHQIISPIKTTSGLLPHFVRKQTPNDYQIHPGTEFSSVDTAIYFHSMLIASRLLSERSIEEALLNTIQQMPLPELLSPSGHLTHGFTDKGERLKGVWKDWGGETALVLLLQHLISNSVPPAMMQKDGKVWQSTGFIPEIQSLFFPGFDSTRQDQISNQNWSSLRQHYLQLQLNYFSSPKSPFHLPHLYGLSAGEGKRGMGYLVSGTDLPQQTIIHPHYILMSACLRPDTKETCALFEHLESMAALPPWGMVENIDTTNGEMLPMLGSLNAALETLSAYHFMVKHRRQPDSIYDAVLHFPPMASALHVFYP